MLSCLSVFILANAFCGCAMIGSLVGAALPYAGVKMMFTCIPEHTYVDTPQGSRPIEDFAAGEMVIGFNGKPVRVLQKHSYLEDPASTFLRITFSDGAKVDLCGMHRLDGVRAGRLRVGQTIAGREVVSIETYSGQTHTFDLLTEDAGYRIQGVPVNSMIEEMSTAAATGLRSVRP